MAKPRVLILRSPGTNCDEETACAFELAGGKATAVHVNRLLDSPAQITDSQILCVAGGFSYGDDLAAGRILGGQLRRHLGEVLGKFRDDGKLVLGVCNGFQVLVKAGLLPNLDDDWSPAVSLIHNRSGRFEDRWVRLVFPHSACVWTRQLPPLEAPVRHGEGIFVAPPSVLEELREHLLVAATYAGCDTATGPVAYPDNPNGSLGDVAGICDRSGRVFGLMPHPENHIFPWQHPRVHRGEGGMLGLRLFENGVRNCE